MATYDFVFDRLGLREWCGERDGGDAPMTMAELLAGGKADDADAPTTFSDIINVPFPSLDALNEACPAMARTRDMTAGVEDGFLAIKDGLKVVLDPITQPLSWLLEGALYVFQNVPCLG